MVNGYYLYPFFVQRLINVNHNLLNVIIPAVLAVFIFSSTLFATNPPHPSLLKKINAGQMKTPYFLANKESLMQRGVSMPWKAPNNNRSQFGPALVPTGPIKALAIVVEFSDNPYSVTATYFDDLLFEQVPGTLWDYFKDVSYGNLDIVTVNLPSSVGWINAPQTYPYYVNGQNGFGAYPNNAQKLVEDVVNAVDPFVDFSLYDNDGDLFVDALFIIHAGPGAEFTGSINDIWSHAWVTNIDQSLDGVIVRQYSMEPEYWAAPGDMTIGVYAHELGHALFGLPDLYDRDGSSAGLGSWSLMAGGSWNGVLGATPSFPDAWSHVEMGYVATTDITLNSANVSIGNVEDNAEVYRLWTDGAASTEYFLVENRQPVSYDAALPGAGLLIYHVDEVDPDFSQNDDEWYPGFTAFGHYQVALEQADGLWDLESTFLNFGDAGDPFPGSSFNTLFDSLSTPESRDYSSTDTHVSVRNISASANLMTADLFVSLEDPPTISVSPDSLGADLFTGGTSTQFITISNDVGGGHLFFDISIASHDTIPALSPTVLRSWEMQEIDMSGWSQSPVSASETQFMPSLAEPETKSNVELISGLAPKVLLLTQDGVPTNAETALISTGLFSDTDIDILDSPSSFTLDNLIPYDAVLVWSDLVFTNSTNIGDVLKQYVDSGGGVVLATYVFSTNWALMGGILDPNYSPFLPAIQQSVSGQINLSTLTNPNHPIFSGITVAPTYWWNSNYSNPTLNAGGILLASDTNGNRVVAENSTGSVVGITVYPGSLTDVSTNAETKLMFANALHYVSTRWLSASPISGTVAPGSTAEIEVTFDAFRLSGGEYKLDVVVASNDSTNLEERVLAHLNVTGAPDITVFEDTLDYGITFIGFPKSFDLMVSNNGVNSLSVTNITVNNAVYTVDKTVFGLNPGERDTVQVSFNPTTVGIFNSTLSITSNDLDESPFTVALLGEAVLPPLMSLTPDTIRQVLVKGDSAVQIITIDNSAGGGELIWNGFSIQSGELSVLTSSPNFVGRGELVNSKSKDNPDFAMKSQSLIYRSEMMVDSKGTRSFAVNNQSLESVLDSLNLKFEDITAAIPDKFDFTDGVVGNNINDGGNDMYDGGNFIGTDLGGPLNYSDDFIIDNSAFGAGGRYFTRKYPGLFVLAADMNGVSNFDITGDLGADGYGNANGSVLRLDHAGITYLGFVKRVSDDGGEEEGGDPSVNHLIIVPQFPTINHEFSTNTDNDFHSVFNLEEVTRLYYLLYAGTDGRNINDEKALRIMYVFLQSLDPFSWIRLTPKSGIVAAGASTTVEVFLDGRLLSAGDHNADIEIITNDPLSEQNTIPIILKVLPPPIDPPEITSIDDVPDDQGGWVTVSWNASPDDDFFSSTPVRSYSIWLRNDYPAAPAFSENEVLLKSLIQIEQVGTNVKVTDLGLNKSNLISSGSKNLSSLSRLKNQMSEPNGMTTIIRSSLSQKGEALPKKLGRVMSDHGRWIGIGSIDATQSPDYTFLVHTQVDSNSSGNNLSVIRISAHPNNPFTFATSQPDSGYSVDNKKPSAPAAAAAGMGAEGLVLNWNPTADNDFDFYAIYKSETSGFDASSQDYFATTTDSFYVDSDIVEGTAYFYRLSSFDFNGNESDFTIEIASGIVGIDGERIGIPTEYALAQNYPNPFNPVTNINYSLPKPGRVSLLIYDLNGQVVMRWDDEATQAGYFQKRWNGTNIAGNKVSSGVYLYRLISGEFVQTRKMLLLK